MSKEKVHVYRKVPVKIRAIKFDGTNAEDVKKFCNKKDFNCGKKPNHLEIYTLEGIMIANVGDYIIEGVNGEFYPCKPDIFKKTYERLNQFDQVIDYE